MNESPNTQQLTFEQALSELEALVRKLEEGRFSLEEALLAYERGTVLKNICEEKLKAAKLKVDQIMIQNDGTISTQPFEEIT